MKHSKLANNQTSVKSMEKALLFFMAFVITLLSCLIIIEGIANIMQKEYISLGDPYYSKNISAFQRLPFVAKTAAGTLALIILIQGGILINEKIRHARSKN